MKEPDSSSQKAVQRRIRRHVLGPDHRFAVITPPELSALCRDELRCLGITETVVTQAGIEYSGDLVSCYLSNLHLRTASRVLCRFSTFRAGVVGELLHKVLDLKWELWLNPRILLQVEAHVEHSRIGHEGLVADTVFSGIRKRFGMLGLPLPELRGSAVAAEPGDRQRIIVHLTHNHCELSLDTTGAHLHQRGYRTTHAVAPMRETLAAAVLLKSGWNGSTPLVDGMCGSGTFPVEAVWMARRLPPGLRRRFLFQEWPSFRQKTWEYLCRRAVEASTDSCPMPVFAMDIDAEALSTAMKNAERAGIQKDITWMKTDFLEFIPHRHGLSPGLLVLNPPYGKRMAEGDDLLYRRLGDHLRTHFAGWRVAVLVPSRSHASQLHMPSIRLWRIVHGGLPVFAAMGRL